MQRENDGRNDFDFLVGNWKMRHRRLKECLKGSTEWEEFEGTAVGKKLLNGLGHCDEVIMNRKTGATHGFTLRLFDVNSKEWSIYWAAGTSGTLDVPVVGKFKDGVGEFYSQEVWEGRHIFCRFTWSKITANSAQWEQAFSIDGGKTWETNWVNKFEGDMVSRKIINGLGILDENLIHTKTGPVHAMALRLFNPPSKEWSIYW